MQKLKLKLLKKELDDNYDISVENMLDMTQEIGGFKLSEEEFSNKKSKLVKKNILRNEEENKQIFSMKDGLFILEVEDVNEGTVEYFFSKDINDLI